MSFTVETIEQNEVVRTALHDFINKGYKILSETEAHEAGAIETAQEWGNKIDIAKEIFKQL